MENIKKIFGKKIIYHSSAQEALEGSDAVIIVTEWNEFKELKPEDFLKMRNPIVIDGRRILIERLDELKRLGIRYYAIGHYLGD